MMTTAVLAPGAGDTTPVMRIGVVPEYVGWLVLTVTVYVTAKAGIASVPTKNMTNANTGAIGRTLLKDINFPIVN